MQFDSIKTPIFPSGYTSLGLFRIILRPDSHKMGQSEATNQDRSVMGSSNIGAAEDGVVTRWNHVKTFALVGVSSTDQS